MSARRVSVASAEPRREVDEVMPADNAISSNLRPHLPLTRREEALLPKASSHFWSSVVDSSRNSLSSIWPTANSSTFAQPLLNLDNANLNTTERDQEVFEESGFVEVPMPPSITSTLSTDSFNLFQTFDIWNPPLIASDISSPSSLGVWSNFSVFLMPVY
ncbi:uncharacterized protein LOC143228494 [Tachypleus tridentatus]|uniref:uncharacterized protein LOC143228494 n=1 Tax=Tachypleus tridentatus TaxID=6853 RepID=UPI003FD0C74C